MAPSLRCWCGHRDFDPFDDDYSGCRRCGTLVLSYRPADDVRAVELSDRGDERGLYSRSYWFERQEQLGLPDLEERSRRDLGERCVRL